MSTGSEPPTLDVKGIEGIGRIQWSLYGDRWSVMVYDEYTKQDYSVRQTASGWTVMDESACSFVASTLQGAIEDARAENRVEGAPGDMLILTIPRDDFALLMKAIAKLDEDIVNEHDLIVLSRIASDLSQQADGQD